VLDQGVITHALRFTVPSTDDSFVFPASHEAGSNNSALPRMGERFRLKQSFDISGFSPADQVILQALKDYGMIVADNGSSWYLSGSPSSRWDDDDLHALTALVGSNFEAIDLTPVVTSLDQASGPSAGGTAVTIHGQNFTGVAGQLQVFFGATAASVSVISDTVIVATAPAHSAGTIDVTVQTPYGTSHTSTPDRFTFTAGTNPPVLSLTAGAGSGAPNFTTSWYNQGPVPIANNILATVAASSGTPTLSSLIIKLTTFHSGDVLSVPALNGVSITSSYSAGTLTLSGTDTLAHYQQALRFVSYGNTAGGPGAASVTAAFVANDGTNSSTPVTATISISLTTGQILGNRLFYNNSKYDGNNGAINANDDLSIASDKTGYNGTGTATFANVSAFNRGITGIMVDLQGGLGTHAAINLTSGDLTFKISPATFVTTTYNQLSTWTTAPTPAAVSVRMGAGLGGSDRLEITWANGAIKNEWIEVNLHSGGNTGLSANDVFYFGSAIGDSGAADTALLAKTDGNDYNVPFNNIVSLTTPVWNLADYTKDGKVDGSDATTAIGNVFTLHYLAAPAGPFKPDVPVHSSESVLEVFGELS
jgi:hypothetical protein